MGGDSAEEEGRLGGVNNLVEDKRRILNARSKGRGISRLVADSERGRLGDRVPVSTPLSRDRLD